MANFWPRPRPTKYKQRMLGQQWWKPKPGRSMIIRFVFVSTQGTAPQSTSTLRSTSMWSKLFVKCRKVFLLRELPLVIFLTSYKPVCTRITQKYSSSKMWNYSSDWQLSSLSWQLKIESRTWLTLIECD